MPVLSIKFYWNTAVLPCLHIHRGRQQSGTLRTQTILSKKKKKKSLKYLVSDPSWKMFTNLCSREVLLPFLPSVFSLQKNKGKMDLRHLEFPNSHHCTISSNLYRSNEKKKKIKLQKNPPQASLWWVQQSIFIFQAS